LFRSPPLQACSSCSPARGGLLRLQMSSCKRLKPSNTPHEGSSKPLEMDLTSSSTQAMTQTLRSPPHKGKCLTEMNLNSTSAWHAPRRRDKFGGFRKWMCPRGTELVPTAFRKSHKQEACDGVDALARPQPRALLTRQLSTRRPPS